MIILSPQRSRTLGAIEILLYTWKPIKCISFWTKISRMPRGGTLWHWLTTPQSAALLLLLLQPASTSLSAPTLSALVFMVICLCWRLAAAQSAKRIARVCYACIAGYKKKRKNLKSYKYTDPKFETNFESSSSTLKVKTSIQIQRKLQKTIAVFLACVCVCCQVLSITVNIQLTDCMPDKHDMPSHRYQLYNNTPIDSPADPHTHKLLT